MSKEMNKFIKFLIKYDLIGAVVFSLILAMSISIEFAIIYIFGFIISTVNFIIHYILVEGVLVKGKNKLIIPMNYFIRIFFVVLLAIPFANKIENLIAYLIGYISHYVVLVFCGIKNAERM